MKRVKRRSFYGPICEQEVYYIREATDVKKSEPKKNKRFQTEEERAAHRVAISRRKHVRLFNANFTHNSLYSTLTLDNVNEVYYPEDMKRLRDNYIRRLRRAYPDAVIFAYIGKGKNTHRFHMHMVSDGIPAEAIESLWKYGKIFRIDNLREHCMYDGVDHGEDYTALANYLFEHWTPEIGGHRWKNTRNAKQPEVEQPTVVARYYDEEHPPMAPRGYMLIDTYSNGYGYSRFIYVLDPKAGKRKHKNE